MTPYCFYEDFAVSVFINVLMYLFIYLLRCLNAYDVDNYANDVDNYANDVIIMQRIKSLFHSQHFFVHLCLWCCCCFCYIIFIQIKYVYRVSYNRGA